MAPGTFGQPLQTFGGTSRVTPVLMLNRIWGLMDGVDRTGCVGGFWIWRVLRQVLLSGRLPVGAV